MDQASGPSRRALEVLAEISRMFGESPLDSDALLTQVCRSVAEVVKDAASVRLLDESGTHLFTAATWHPSARIRALFDVVGPVRLPVALDPTGPVLHLRQGMLVPELPWTPALWGAMPEALRNDTEFPRARPHTLIAAPLRARGRHLGVLVATRHDTLAAYTADDLELLEDIAVTIAHAVASVTDLAALDRERATSAVRAAAERRWKILVDTLPALVSYIDADMRYQLANQAYADWFGIPPEQVVGMTVEQLLGPEAVALLKPRLDAAFVHGQRVDFTQEVPYRIGGKRVVDGSYVPDTDANGAVRGVAVLIRDVTPARRAEERMAVLAEASRILTSSRDTAAMLRALAEAIVPRFADWFGVEIASPGGVLELHTAYNADPERLRFALHVRQRWPPDPRAPAGPMNVLRTGRPELHQLDDTQLEAHVTDPEKLAATRQIGPRSLIYVPIPTATGTFGVLNLSTTTESGRRWEQADLALAQELAARIGLALDNARLFAEARAADHAKDQFLAMLAHELRNPLAPILSGLQLIRKRGDAPVPERSLDAMERQARNLARLVDDLLDISRITSGMVELRRETCDLRALIDAAVDTTRPLLEQRNHELVVDVPHGLLIDADPVRIEQVFANLLNNATKYTDPGGRIAVTAHVRGETVTVDVADNGMGISRDILPQVFQPFRQGAVSIERARGGLGLGLALVQQLVGMHGGTAEARSPGPGLGSTFTVDLPLAVSLDAAGTEAAPATLMRKVLVVDDNLDAAEAIRELLDAVGHDVRVAVDGRQALSAMDGFPADVVLLDLGLPEMDGYEVARTLRARGARARIIALSGYGREEDRKASRAAGFDAHLVKPVDVDTLLATLER